MCFDDWEKNRTPAAIWCYYIIIFTLSVLSFTFNEAHPCSVGIAVWRFKVYLVTLQKIFFPELSFEWFVQVFEKITRQAGPTSKRICLRRTLTGPW
jgi:ABA responsive element binding factor